MPKPENLRKDPARAAGKSPAGTRGETPGLSLKRRLAIIAAAPVVVLSAYFLVCVIFDDYRHTYSHQFSEHYASQPVSGIFAWLVLKINNEHIGDWEFMQILGAVQWGLLAIGVTWWWTRPARRVMH